MHTPNTAAICLLKNPILHSKAKHIEIKHHFIRDCVQKGILDIQFIDPEHQWIDIFTKPLTVEMIADTKQSSEDSGCTLCTIVLFQRPPRNNAFQILLN